MLIGYAGARDSSSTQQQNPATTIKNGGITYTAHGGETPAELSARYGVTEQQILAANPQLRSLGVLKAGQEITIPVVDNGNKLPTQTPIGKGASLTSIANAAHVSLVSLAEANGLSSTSLLNYPGALWVPVNSSAKVGVSPGSAFGSQQGAVDAAVKQYSSAQTPAQQKSAAAAVAQTVENELSARAAVEVPAGQSPSDALLSEYAGAIGSRYGSDPGVTAAIQQGVSNEEAAVATTTAVSKGNAPQVAAAITTEIQTRAGGQTLTSAQVQQYVTQIEQRYANNPAAAKLVSTAVQTAAPDILAQQIVTQADAAGNTSQQLAALNAAYVKATAPVQKALLSQPGVVAILKASAAQDMQPLTGAETSSFTPTQVAALEQSLQSLDKSAGGLDPAVAAALVSQAMPALQKFNTLYAKYIEADPRHEAGRQVVFYAGDDVDAKATIGAVLDEFGFAPVDIGPLREGGQLMQVNGGPLSGLHLLKQD